MGRKPKFTKEVAEAIRESKGLLTAAANFSDQAKGAVEKVGAEGVETSSKRW